MKKALSAVLVLALVFTFAQAGFTKASAYVDGPYTFTLSGSFATITKYTGPGGSLVIPENMSGSYPVVGIGSNAFSYHTTLTSVTLPIYCYSIEQQAFSGCSALTSILVNSSNAFFRSVDGVLYNAATTVLYVYPGGKIGSYSIPSGVTEIKSCAFEYCTRLSGIVLPNTLTTIGGYAFYGCSMLSAVNIPAGVTQISLSAFGNCQSLTQINVDEANTVYSSAGGVLFNETKTKLTSYPSGKTGPYTVPAGVTEISENAFTFCEYLSEVNIPEGVTLIASGNFVNCTGLTSVHLPSTLTEIRNYGFYHCSSLAQVCIPANVSTIGNYAFCFNSSLQWAFFRGNAPVLLGSDAFRDCSAGFTVYYQSGASGFSNPWQGHAAQVFAPSFTLNPATPTSGSVTVTVNYPAIAITKEYQLPGGPWTEYTGPVVMTHNGTLLARCTGPCSAASPETACAVTNIIDASAPATPVLAADPVLPTDDPVTVSIEYPADAAVMEFKVGAGAWEPYKDPIKILANCTVYARCFDEAGNVSETGSIVINYIGVYDYVYTIAGSEATIIGYNGPGGDLVIPDTLGTFPVVVIANDAFQYCATLTSVDIPDTVTLIGNGAFYRCKALQSVVFPEGLTRVGESAFQGCISLGSVTFPEGTDTIGDNAFRYCESLAWAYFTGDAPKSTGISMFDDALSGFTVWYRSRAEGFDKEWNGYTARIFEPKMSASPKTPTNGDVLVTIDYPGPATIREYRVNGGSWLPYTAPVVLDENAWVFALCSDEYGYTCPTVALKVNNIDKQPPDAPVFHAVPEYETTGYVTVAVSFAPDAVVRQIAFESTGTVWTNYTGPVVLWENDIIYARCFDAAGNSSEEKIKISNIITIGEGMIEKRGSTTVIDRKAKFIYGLQPGMSVDVFEHDYIELVGGARIEYVPKTSQITTGTRINVYNDHNALIDSYVVVIFGDVNGDGNIDTGDAGLIVDFENFFITWDPEADAALYFAADLNGDGNIDTADAGIVVDCENFLLAIDQVTGRPGPA
ncbi:MAG TPA: leucine-rich repeat protein [Clostridiales bacterium]|nr:leucine-rich repeat protein [Clostridiales bacterium]HQK73444.1 leucine-rich repeat protein [Clostridiales bacterium]